MYNEPWTVIMVNRQLNCLFNFGKGQEGDLFQVERVDFEMSNLKILKVRYVVCISHFQFYNESLGTFIVSLQKVRCPARLGGKLKDQGPQDKNRYSEFWELAKRYHYFVLYLNFAGPPI